MPNTSTQERVGLILDANVSAFEQGLRRAGTALEGFRNQAVDSLQRFEGDMQNRLAQAEQTLTRFGTKTDAGKALRASFSAAKKEVAAFQRELERIAKDTQAAQAKVAEAITKTNTYLELNERKTAKEIEAIRRESAAERERILASTTAREEKALAALNASAEAANNQRKAIESRAQQEITDIWAKGIVDRRALEQPGKGESRDIRALGKTERDLKQTRSRIESLANRQVDVRQRISKDPSLAAALVQSLSIKGISDEEILRRAGITRERLEHLKQNAAKLIGSGTRVDSLFSKGANQTITSGLRQAANEAAALARKKGNNVTKAEEQAAASVASINKRLFDQLAQLRSSDSTRAINQQRETSEKIRRIIEEGVAKTREAAASTTKLGRRAGLSTDQIYKQRQAEALRIQRETQQLVDAEVRKFDQQQRNALISREASLSSALETAERQKTQIVERAEEQRTRVKEAAGNRQKQISASQAAENQAIAKAEEKAKTDVANVSAKARGQIKKQESILAEEEAKRQKAASDAAAAGEARVDNALKRRFTRRQSIVQRGISDLEKARAAEQKNAAAIDQAGRSYSRLEGILNRLARARRSAEAAGDGGGLGRGARGLGGAGGIGGGGLQQINSSINRLRIGILNVQTALGLVGASFGVRQSLDLATQFERELASVNTLLVNAQVPIERYREQLVNLSVESSKDLIDLTQGLYTTISAGVPAVEGAAGAFELLVEAQKAAVAGNATTRQSVNALITTVKAYSNTGITAAEASDKLFTTVRLGRTTFEDLSTSIGRILGITANFGLSLDESLAAVATITRVIPSTAESITQLRALIRGIVRPAKQVSTLIADINERTGAQLEFSAAALKEQGLSGIIREILDVTGGDPDILARLFPNVRALGGAAVLTADTFRDFVDSLDQLGDSAGATDVALKKVEGTLQEQSRVLRSRFQKVLIEIGEKSFPLIKEALVDIGNFLEDNQGLFGEFFSGILVTARDLFTFLRQNFDNLVRAVEGFLLVKFPVAFAAFKALLAPEGQGLGVLANALVLGLGGSFLLSAFSKAGTAAAAKFLAKFAPAVAAGTAGALRTGFATAAASIAGSLVSLIGTAVVIGLGLAINKGLEAAKRETEELARGERSSLSGFAAAFADQDDRDRAAAVAKESTRAERLAESYKTAARAAQEAGLAVLDFYETLEKNRGNVDKTVTELRKSLEGARDLALSGQLLEIEPGAINRIFRSISAEADEAREQVSSLQEAIIELRVGSTRGSEAERLFAQAKAELGDRATARSVQISLLGRAAGNREGEDNVPLIRQRAREIAEAELAERNAALEEFDQDRQKAAFAQQEAVVNAYKAQLQRVQGELRQATDDATRAALESTIKRIGESLRTDLEPELERLRGLISENLSAGDLIEFNQVGQGIFDAVKKASEAGEISLQRVIRNAPRLTPQSTPAQVLDDQSAAQLEQAQFLVERIPKLREELEANLKAMAKDGVTDRALEDYRKSVEAIRKELEAAENLSGQLEQGLASPAEAAAARFEEMGRATGLSVDAARELGKEISEALNQGRYDDAIKAMRTIGGEVNDIAGSLRLWALEQRETIGGLTRYSELQKQVKEAEDERSRLQQLVFERQEEVNFNIANGTQRIADLDEVLLKGAKERLTAQEDIVKSLTGEIDRRNEILKATEALIDRIVGFLTRQQPKIPLDKERTAAFEAARAIAEFDREEEKIRRKRAAEDIRVATLRLEIENRRFSLLEKMDKLQFQFEFDSFKGLEQQTAKLDELRKTAEASLRPLQELQSASLDLERALVFRDSERGTENRTRAIERLRKQADELRKRAIVAEANRRQRKKKQKSGAEGIPEATAAIDAEPPSNLIPGSFIRELVRLDQAIAEAQAVNDEKRLEQLAQQLGKLLRESRTEVAGRVKFADDANISLLEEQARLLNERLTQAAQNAKSNIDLVRSSLEQALASLREFRQFAESEDPLERAIAPAASLDRSQALLDIRRAELALFPARKATLDQELKLQQLAAKAERDRIRIRREALQQEEDRSGLFGNARNEEAIAADRALVAEQERAVDASLRAAEQTRKIELEKLEIARKKLIVETSILPTAVLARTADDLAAKFAELLQGYLPSVFETAAKAAFSKISEGVVALEELLGVDILPNLGNAEPTVVIEDKFGTTLKDIVDAIERAFGNKGDLVSPGPSSPPLGSDVLGVDGASAGSSGSAGSTKSEPNVPGGPVEPDPAANTSGGPVDPDPNANVETPGGSPVVSSAFGVIFSQYRQAVELLSNALFKAADVFSSKVINPLLDVSFAGIDNLLGGLSEALGILTDLGQTFEAQVITRGPRGSDLTNLRRREAAEVFAEERARREGLIPRQSGEGSAAGRAIRSLEKAAKDALKLAERILDGLPQIVDKFLDLLIDRGPELIEKAGQALVLVVRKLLQRLPEIVRALVPVIADVVILLVEELIDNLPSIIEAFADLFAILAVKAGELFGKIVGGIARNFDEIVKSLIQAFPKIIAGLIVGVASGVARAVVEVLKGLIPGSGSFSGGLFGAGLGALAGGLAFGPIGALVGGGLGSLFGSIFHDGGEVTKAGTPRQMRKNLSVPSIGDRLSQTLRSDEVPAVLQVGERVLSRRQVASLGGQSGIDQLLAGNTGPTEVNSNVVLSYQPTGDDAIDVLAQLLLPRMNVRATTNVARNTRAGSRPARGRN